MVSAYLLPEAEWTLSLGVRRAVDVLAAGGSVEDAERALSVAGAAAELIESQRETLGDATAPD